MAPMRVTTQPGLMTLSNAHSSGFVVNSSIPSMTTTMCLFAASDDELKLGVGVGVAIPSSPMASSPASAMSQDNKIRKGKNVVGRLGSVHVFTWLQNIKEQALMLSRICVGFSSTNQQTFSLILSKSTLSSLLSIVIISKESFKIKK